VDTGVAPGAWSYWLTASRPGEPSSQAGPVAVTVPGVPRVLAISPARPNPFRDGTSVAVSLDQDGPFVVRVFHADGRLVRTLARGPGRAAGFLLTWDGRDDRGRPAGAGIYFIELRSAGRTRVQKAVLLR
ncbi:MAG TPA: FlgD immunoglobulin-like domain containing protein, partial [Candidatus Omnitrophota bacterium]|nr:FlgD immunoglobulin-like domain containing protein [Candidatus Omnitrophota bacterium]